MTGNKKKIIAIVGPTASGKTGIGVKLAKEYNGEIVSADSRQVYRGLDLGTGKEGKPAHSAGISNDEFLMTNQISNCPNNQFELKKGKLGHWTLGNWKLVRHSKLEIRNLQSALRFVDNIPQWMVDVVDPGENFTLFDYLPLARLVIEDILSRGKLPIIAGGSGLYVQGLVEGFELKPVRQIPNTRYQIPSLEGLSREELQKILKKVDPDAYQSVDLNNPHRLIRAIKRAEEGLVPSKIKPDFETLQIGVELPRKELFDRIDRRVEERFEAGMLDEVIGLLDSGVNPEWLMRLGLEYRVITQFLIRNFQFSINDPVNNESMKIETFNENCKPVRPAGGLKIENSSEFKAMEQDLKFKIHQFARRQLTWFRRFPEINWLSDYDQMKRFVKIFLEH